VNADTAAAVSAGWGDVPGLAAFLQKWGIDLARLCINILPIVLIAGIGALL